MKKSFFIFFICITSGLFAENLDSLLKVIPNHKHDSEYVSILTYVAGLYDDIGEYDKSISFCMSAKKVADSIHSKYGQQSALNNLGNSYLDRGDVKKALECHLQVLKLREELKQKRGIAYTYLNLGNIYFRLGQDEDALKNYEHAMKLLYETGDTLRVATCLSNMGSIHSNKLMDKEAEQYYLKALAIRKRYNDVDGIAETLSNLSVTLMDAKKYKEALDYAFQTITLYGDAGNKLGKAISYSNIGDIYEHMGDLTNAIKYQTISMDLATEMKSAYMLQTNYQLLALAFEKKNDFEKAVLYAELFSRTRDSMMSSENGKMIAEMQTRFETGKKEKEIQLLQSDKSIRDLQMSKQETNINRQRIIIYTIIGGLLIMVFLIIFIWRGYRQKKKIQMGLERKNTEINLQKNEIEEKSKLITDSIDYARTIQNAILPPDEKIKHYFPDSFIVYEPKDIVSGDFYWLSEVKDTILFATVDCAGEGVPGAFTSILVNNMLENIALDKKLIDPSLIVDELKKSNYKMDISLIAWNRKKSELKFSGNKMPLIVIGDSGLNKFTPEENQAQTIPLKKGDMVYIFTDGLALQNGLDNFSDLLKSIANKNIEEQKQILKDKMRNVEQKDDVLVVGIRV